MFPQIKQELSARLHENRKYENIIRTMSTIEQTAFEKLLDHRHFQELRESQIEESLYKRKQLAEKHAQRTDQIERLAGELDRHNRLEIRDEKMRQQIRETSQELRELETKLRSAYVGKALRAQLAEKEVERLQEKVNRQRDQENWLAQRQADEVHHKHRKAEEKEQKIVLRKELQDQMMIKHQRNQILYEEFLSEKKELDEIVRRIQEEHMIEMHEQLIKRERFISDLEQFRESQIAWNKKQQNEIDEENRRIIAYLEERDRKLVLEKQLAEAKKQNTSDLAERMGAELLEIETQKKQREELLLLLKVEELQEKADVKDRATLEQKFRDRLEIRLQLEQQQQHNIDNRIQEQDRDRKYRAEQLQLLAERDRIDQLTNEKKRQKIMEHHRIVREQLMANKNKRAQELAELVAAEKRDLESKERIQQIIEEERIKILKEHAAELVGFFPPGVLRQTDRDILNV